MYKDFIVLQEQSLLPPTKLHDQLFQRVIHMVNLSIHIMKNVDNSHVIQKLLSQSSKGARNLTLKNLQMNEFKIFKTHNGQIKMNGVDHPMASHVVWQVGTNFRLFLETSQSLIIQLCFVCVFARASVCAKKRERDTCVLLEGYPSHSNQ